jgi:hypothetical protein
MQPYRGARLGIPWLIMLALLFAVAFFLAATRPRRQVLKGTYDIGAATRPEGAPENARVLFTEPFELSGQHNVEVWASASLANAWLYLAFDLVDESTGQMQSFELPLEYYSGRDSSGESWSEGSRTRSIVLSSPPKGRYVMRVEGQWEPGKPPWPFELRVREGVFRLWHLAVALIAISIFPALALIRQASFEARRWAESAHSPYGDMTIDSEDDEEEE